jgi:IMP dehydrogenase/GMP reductase
MAKKDFANDLQNFVRKGEKEKEPEKEAPAVETPKERKPRGVGRPKEHEPYEKTTVTFPPEMMGKLKVMCLYQGKQIREVLADALDKYINEYEQEHGAIRVPPRFRDDK